MEPKEHVICEDVQFKDLRQLAVQVCLKAFKDAKDCDPLKALDALMWLTSDDAPWWYEWAGMPFVDPLQFVTSGRLRRARLWSKGKVTE